MILSSRIGSASGASAYQPPTRTKATPSDDPMATAISNLKSSDPELADKLGKISERRAELQKSGVSESSARETIESEFGRPTEAEMTKIAAAGGPPKPGGSGGPNAPGGPKGPPPPKAANAGDASGSTSVNASDLQAFLDSMGSNSAVAQLLSSRIAASTPAS